MAAATRVRNIAPANPLKLLNMIFIMYHVKTGALIGKNSLEGDYTLMVCSQVEIKRKEIWLVDDIVVFPGCGPEIINSQSEHRMFTRTLFLMNFLWILRSGLLS